MPARTLIELKAAYADLVRRVEANNKEQQDVQADANRRLQELRQAGLGLLNEQLELRGAIKQEEARMEDT